MSYYNLNGKSVFITGATAGIGKEVAMGLARLGAAVVFTTRDEGKGLQVKDEIILVTSNKNIDMFFCDLGSFESIRKCCMQFKESYKCLDVLINNAGVFHSKRKVTTDGIETHFAINYLAPFLMTRLLLPVLKKSSSSRIINVTSGLHIGRINFDDIEYKHNFSGWDAYRQSKLALILFTKYLATQLKGTRVTVNCVNPKMTNTNIVRDAGFLYRMYFKLFGRDARQSAETLIYLASAPELDHITGQYFVDKQIQQTSLDSDDMGTIKKLWELSETYVGLRDL